MICHGSYCLPCDTHGASRRAQVITWLMRRAAAVSCFPKRRAEVALASSSSVASSSHHTLGLLFLLPNDEDRTPLSEVLPHCVWRGGRAPMQAFLEGDQADS